MIQEMFFLTKLCLNIGIDRYSREINLIQNEMERRRTHRPSYSGTAFLLQ